MEYEGNKQQLVRACLLLGVGVTAGGVECMHALTPFLVLGSSAASAQRLSLPPLVLGWLTN